MASADPADEAGMVPGSSTAAAAGRNEERPVPQGRVEPDRLSPTQPFVTDFPNVLKPDLQAPHVGRRPWTSFGAASSSAARTIAASPPRRPRRRPWIQFPGYNGGSGWGGGVAVDRHRSIMVANYNITANRNQLMPRERPVAWGPRPSTSWSRGRKRPRTSPRATPLGHPTEPGLARAARWRAVYPAALWRDTAIDLRTRQVSSGSRWARRAATGLRPALDAAP